MHGKVAVVEVASQLVVVITVEASICFDSLYCQGQYYVCLATGRYVFTLIEDLK